MRLPSLTLATILGIYLLIVAAFAAIGLLLVSLNGQPAVASAQEWIPGEEASAMALPAAVQTRLDELGDAKWQVRDEAGRWLIRNRDQWIDRIAADYQPAGAEAEWRWQQVLKTVNQLLALPTEMQKDRFDAVRWKLLKLHRDLEGDIVAEALSPILDRPEERLRVRAARLLCNLDGVDPIPHLNKLAHDESPWVRRTLYDIAIDLDPVWAEKLLHRGLRSSKGSAVRREIVQATRRHGSYKLLQELRSNWTKEDDSVRFEIALAICGRKELADRVVLRWMLESNQYRLLLPALRELDEVATAEDIEVLVRLVESNHFEIRARAGDILIRVGNPEHAIHVLHYLDSEAVDRVNIAAQCIVSWKAEDFYADVAQAMKEIPREQRTIKMVSRDGMAIPVIAPSRMSKVGVTRSPFREK